MATQQATQMHRPLRASPLLLQCPLLKRGKELVGSCNKKLVTSSCSSLLVKGWWPHHQAVVLHFRGKQNNPNDSHLPSLPRAGACGAGRDAVCSVHPRDLLPSRGYLSTQHLYETLVISYERNSGTEELDLPKETYGKRQS